MDWIELAQDMDKMAGTCECGNERSGSINYGTLIWRTANLRLDLEVPRKVFSF